MVRAFLVVREIFANRCIFQVSMKEIEIIIIIKVQLKATSTWADAANRSPFAFNVSFGNKRWFSQKFASFLVQYQNDLPAALDTYSARHPLKSLDYKNVQFSKGWHPAGGCLWESSSETTFEVSELHFSYRTSKIVSFDLLTRKI